MVVVYYFHVIYVARLLFWLFLLRGANNSTVRRCSATFIHYNLVI